MWWYLESNEGWLEGLGKSAPELLIYHSVVPELTLKPPLHSQNGRACPMEPTRSPEHSQNVADIAKQSPRMALHPLQNAKIALSIYLYLYIYIYIHIPLKAALHVPLRPCYSSRNSFNRWQPDPASTQCSLASAAKRSLLDPAGGGRGVRAT